MNSKKINIAILIVHGGNTPNTGRWIDFCLKQIEQFTCRSDYKIFLWDNNDENIPILNQFIDKDLLVRFKAHPFEKLTHPHAVPLERLWQIAKKNNPNYIITLDSDAFPIKKGWLDFMLSKISEQTPLCGVWRNELEKGIPPYIHPSCLCVSSLFIKKIGYRFDDILEDIQQSYPRDTLSLLTEKVLEKGLSVVKFQRANKNNVHYLIGGIYGEYIFHNGAGSRNEISFWDEKKKEQDEIQQHLLIKEASAYAIQNYYEDYIKWLLGKPGFEETFQKILNQQKKILAKGNRQKTRKKLAKKAQKVLSLVNVKKAESGFVPMEDIFKKEHMIPIPEGWHQTKPSFIGIGVPKAGTSWLFHLLSNHPQVVPHRVLKKNKKIAKELYFFNHNFFEPIQADEIKHYHSAFIGLPGTVCGEFSTAYLHHPGAINSLKKTVPNAKLIIILRNPIHRTFSHLNHLLRNRARKLKLTKDPSLLKFYYKHDLIHFAVRHSLYTEAIIQLLTSFPRDKVKILLYEELKDRTLETMQSIYQFLGIYPDFKLPDVNEKINKQDYIIPAFTQGQTTELIDIFNRDVKALDRLLPQLKVLEHWREFRNE